MALHSVEEQISLGKNLWTSFLLLILNRVFTRRREEKRAGTFLMRLSGPLSLTSSFKLDAQI